MAKQDPSLFLIKKGNGDDPLTFDTLCGLNTKSMTLGGEPIDISTFDCTGSGANQWGEFAQGVNNMTVSGTGFFESKAQSTALVTRKMTGDAKDDFQVIVPGLGTFEGKFLIGDLGFGAALNGGAVSMEVALSSTGAVTFTAAP